MYLAYDPPFESRVEGEQLQISFRLLILFFPLLSRVYCGMYSLFYSIGWDYAIFRVSVEDEQAKNKTDQLIDTNHPT